MAELSTILRENPRYALLSDGKLRQLLRTRHPEVPSLTLRALREARIVSHPANEAAREVVHARVPKPRSFYRLTGPMYSFQMDIMFLKRYRASNSGYGQALVAVDQLSRKAFVIPMKGSTTAALIAAYKDFELELPPHIIPVLIKADDEFNNAELRAYIEKPGTVVKTVISKEENAGTGGGPLRIVDRFITTLRKALTQYFVAHGSTNWVSEALPEVLDSYNEDQVHSSVGVTPGEAFQNTDDLLALRLGDQLYNARLSEEGPQLLPPGTVVRVVRPRTTFDKASDSHRLSLERYVVEGTKNGKYRLRGLPRLYKTTEVVRARSQTAPPPPPPEALNSTPAGRAPNTDRNVRRLRREGLEPGKRAPRKARRSVASKALDAFDSDS